MRLTPAEIAALDAKQDVLTQRPGMKRADSSPSPAGRALSKLMRGRMLLATQNSARCGASGS